MNNAKITYYPDEYRLCRQTDVPGAAPVIDIYNDRRAGMTFPTANNPGYYCIFGLKNVVTHRAKRPLELLAEREDTDQRKLFTALCKDMRLLKCERVYADCSKSFESSEMDFEATAQRLGVDTIGLYDASDFDGFDSSYANFEAAKAPLDDYGHQGILIIPGTYKVMGQPYKGRWPGDCLITRDFKAAGKSDIKSSGPWEQYPAATAFNHIIMSYVISPWSKPETDSLVKQSADFNGYGG